MRGRPQRDVYAFGRVSDSCARRCIECDEPGIASVLIIVVVALSCRVGVVPRRGLVIPSRE